MDFSPEALIAVTIGIGLAAASGLRVFLPLLVAGLAARYGALPLSEGFQWLSSTGALIALSTASVLEVAAYSIPGLDHLLDLLAGPVALVAGVIASAAVMVHLPPAVMWPLAIVGGGGVALSTKLTSALLRAKTGVVTGGLANPIVATSETAAAVAISVFAIVIPLICFFGVMALIFWMSRQVRRRINRRVTPKAPIE
jgi:hypothetical protein